MQKDKQQTLLPPPKVSGHCAIPRHIKPELQPVVIEILCWGLRPVVGSNLASAATSVQFECNGEAVVSASLNKQNKTLNCPEPQLKLETVCISDDSATLHCGDLDLYLCKLEYILFCYKVFVFGMKLKACCISASQYHFCLQPKWCLACWLSSLITQKMLFNLSPTLIR